MYLTIVLRKEVADVPTATVLTDIVRAKLADKPDIIISASVGQQIEATEP